MLEGEIIINNQINLLEEIFEVSPYMEFDISRYKVDIQGWGSNRSIFLDLIEEHKPSIIIEVGCWKGASAIYMGNHIKKLNLDCIIICIDTWLGSMEHCEKKDSEKEYFIYESLNLKNGYPQLYFQFLSNVIQHDLQDIIIPIPNTSSTVARWLKKKNIIADIVYIDGSHEEPDVYSDIVNYYDLLRGGGIIIGDDYKWFKGVRNAVQRFSIERNQPYHLTEDNNPIWAINK